MKPTPPGWPRISSSLTYDDPHAAIDWLCKAFGFEVRIKVTSEDGAVIHSELTYGDGVIMVSGTDAKKAEKFRWRRTPSQVGGGNTQSLFAYVDDVDAHCQRAREAGARIASELTVNDYGAEYWADKTYECIDIGGHHWWFSERVRG